RVGRPVKVISHPARRGEPAVALVNPLVIRTNEFAAMPLFLRANTRAPVATAVEEGAKPKVIATDNDQRVGAHLECEIVARPRRLAGKAAEQPAPAENSLHLQLENFVAGVERLRQSEAGTAVGGKGSVEHGWRTPRDRH